MIDKKLNVIKDKVKSHQVKGEDLVLTKDETKYLLRLLEIVEVELNDYRITKILEKRG